MATANLWRETQGCHWCHGEKHCVCLCIDVIPDQEILSLKFVCSLFFPAGWWLYLPLWKIWKSLGRLTSHILWKIKHVPNHQASLDWWPSTWIFIQTQPLFSTWTPSEHLSRPSAAAPGSVDQSIHGALGESDVQALQALGDIFPGRKRELDR